MSLNFISSEPTFTFKQRAGRLNWRQIQGLDLSRIVETGDVVSLQSVLENITYASLDREDLERFSDSSLIKLFKLSQLSIEYLMHSQNKLYSQAQSLDSQYKETSSRAAAYEDSVKAKEKELVDLKREVQHKRKTLATYDFLLKQPQTAVNLATSKSVSAFKCSQCSKHFLNQSFLDKHQARRHVQQEDTAKSSETTAMMEMIKALVSQNIQALSESHVREVESLKYTFERQLTELQRSQEQLEAQRSQIFDSQKQSPTKEDAIKDFFMQQRQHESSQLMKVIEDQRISIERLTQSITEVNERLTLKSEEAAKAQALQGIYEERAKVEAQKVVAQELLKQRVQFEAERSSLTAQIQAAKEQEKTPLTVSTPPETPDVIRAETPVRPRAPPPKMLSNAEELELDVASPRQSPQISSNAGDLELDTSDRPVEAGNVVESLSVPEALKAEPEVVKAEEKRAADEDYEEDFEEEVLTARNKRVELGAGVHDSAEFEEVSILAKRISIDEAAKQLGIEEAELIHIAADYLGASMPEGWTQLEVEGQVYYRSISGLITTTNPNLETYRKVYTQAKTELTQRYTQVTSRLRLLLKERSFKVLTEKYPEGINSHFEHVNDSFGPARGLLRKEFESQRSSLTESSRSVRVSADLLAEFAMIRVRVKEEVKDNLLKHTEEQKELPNRPSQTKQMEPTYAPAEPLAVPSADEIRREAFLSKIPHKTVDSFSDSFERASSEHGKPPIARRPAAHSSHERFFLDNRDDVLVIEAELNDIGPVVNSQLLKRRALIASHFKLKSAAGPDDLIEVSLDIRDLLNRKGLLR
jgi:hypothetical protein